MEPCCQRCGRGREECLTSRKGFVSTVVEQLAGDGTGECDGPTYCFDCLVAPGEALELLEAPALELQAMDTRRETALMAATQTLDAAATSAEVLEQADAFLAWLRADDDLDDRADGAPGR